MTLRIKLFIFTGVLLIVQAVAISFFIILTMANNELATREQFVSTITQIISSNVEPFIAEDNVGELITQFTSISLALSSKIGDERRSDVLFVAAYKDGALYEGIRKENLAGYEGCLLYTSPSPRDRTRSRMPSSA